MKTNTEKWLNNIGEFCVPKRRDIENDEEYAIRSNSTKYIKFSKDVALAKGSTIRLQKYEEYVDGLNAKGFLKDGEYEKKMERKAYAKYILNLPPQKQDIDIETSSKWINNALEIRRDKNGAFYIMVKENFTLKQGDTLPLKKVTDNIKEMVVKGIIDQDTADQRIDKLRIKDEDGNLTDMFWLIYSGNIPPAK